MAEENTQPYVKSKPGDLWTAEIWNDTQVKIKKDIETKVKELKVEIDKNGVNFAKNADKFAGKTPEEFKNDIDQKYSSKTHDHATKFARYFLRFSKEKAYAFVAHDFNGFPQIDVLTLKDVTKRIKEISDLVSSDGKKIKFLLYKKDEAENYMETSLRKGLMGIPLIDLLEEYRINYVDSDTLGDLRERLWEKLFAKGNDNISHASSPSVENDCAKNETIKTLKTRGDGQEILLFYLPYRGNLFMKPSSSFSIYYINYSSLRLNIDENDLKEGEVVDVMITIRP